MSNAVQSFDTLIISLNFLIILIINPTKLFSDLANFSDTNQQNRFFQRKLVEWLDKCDIY